jgi:hypothetical protein
MEILELLLMAIFTVWTIAICVRCAVVVHSLAKRLPATKCDGGVIQFAGE